jgi:transcriptional regulator with XRE-family HTH domain
VEGALRGLERDMTQQEMVRAIQKDLGVKLSQSYLSQLESGKRPHMTNTTRTVLARFFKVHPGYLVEDPEGFHYELTSDLPDVAEKLDLWLINGAERFRRDGQLSAALLRIARHKESRKGLTLLGTILDTPMLLDRLWHVLEPSAGSGGPHKEDKVKPARQGGPRHVNRKKPGGGK